MDFQVGERVVHRVYGLGEIIQVDQKTLLGQTTDYYIVRVGDLTVWVQVRGPAASSLRLPTPAGDFKKLFAILSSPGQPLSIDRMERKKQLADQLKDGTLSSLCQVVRDLTDYGRSKKMNDNDAAILARALKSLLDEWAFSNSISIVQARQNVDHLLGSD